MKTKPVVQVRRDVPGHWVGDGFPVRSMFSYRDSGVSPFLLLDYGGPYPFDPTEAKLGVGEHPHRGFETVTIVFSGGLEHRDSGGNAGKIGPGDVQWMTAASGVVHEEFHSVDFARDGGLFHMIQLWVNLPRSQKMSAPKYQEITQERITTVALGDGATARVIAGELNGTAGAAQTFTPLNLWDVTIPAGVRVELPIPQGHNTLALVMTGKAQVNGTHDVAEAELAVFESAGEGIVVAAQEETHLMLLSGEPIDEPVVGHGPFVMNTQREIAEAIADYQAGKMGTLG
jgi:redox-sensitive bicupin YhaK (pirin superfamily)